MPIAEFEIIQRYFRRERSTRSDVRVGIGDDAAIVRVAPGLELVAVLDTLVGTGEAECINAPEAWAELLWARVLNRLAACGARPAWATLSLTLQRPEARWLEAFAASLHRTAGRLGIALVGGDTTRGPASVTLSIVGTVPAGTALSPAGANAGDRLFVTASPDPSASIPGAANPERLAQGEALRGLASACAATCDGLAAAVRAICRMSGVDVTWDRERLDEHDDAVNAAFELCFCIPPNYHQQLSEALADCRLVALGTVVAGPGSTPASSP